jgi:hypothetical protein
LGERVVALSSLKEAPMEDREGINKNLNKYKSIDDDLVITLKNY